VSAICRGSPTAATSQPRRAAASAEVEAPTSIDRGTGAAVVDHGGHPPAAGGRRPGSTAATAAGPRVRPARHSPTSPRRRCVLPPRRRRLRLAAVQRRLSASSKPVHRSRDGSAGPAVDGPHQTTVKIRSVPAAVTPKHRSKQESEPDVSFSRGAMTTESSKNGAIAMSRMNVSGYAGHTTIGLTECLLLHAL